MRVALFTILAAAVPRAAMGDGDLQVSMAGGVAYDSNVFRNRSGGESDVGLRLAPRLSVRAREARYRWNIAYGPAYRTFVRRRTPNDVDHFVSGSIDADLGPRTRLTASNRFTLTRNQALRFGLGDRADDEDPQADDVDRRRRTLRNTLQLGLERSFTSRLQGAATFSWGHLDPDAGRIGVDTVSGSASASYGLGADASVGFGGSVTGQLFDTIPNQPGSTTLIYHAFLSLVRRIGGDTTVTVRVGPSWIDSAQSDLAAPLPVSATFPNTRDFVRIPAGDPNGRLVASPGAVAIPDAAACAASAAVRDPRTGNAVPVFGGPGCSPVINVPAGDPLADFLRDPTSNPPATLSFGAFPAPRQRGDRRLTVFGEARVSHRWSPEINSSISYGRSESDSSGLGGTSIRDRVTLRTSWRPTELWEFEVRGQWTQRNSATNTAQRFAQIRTDPSPSMPPAELIRFTGNLIAAVSQRNVDNRRWAGEFSARRRISPRASLDLFVRYNNTENTGARGAGFENVEGRFQFRYDFRPVRLWN